MPATLKQTKANPTVAAEATPSDDAQSLIKIANAEPVITKMVGSWKDVDTAVMDQRDNRKQRVDIEAMQNAGEIGISDTFIAIRTIDNNIVRAIPPLVSFIVQPNRNAVFTESKGQKVQPNIIQELESEYTRVTRYPGWDIEWLRLIDGAEFLGWCWCEVLYDDKKPGHVNNEFVATDELIYDTSIKSIQDSRVVIRRFTPTMVKFLELAKKYGFDGEQVKQIKEKLRGQNPTQSSDETKGGPQILKVFFKEAGIVYCAWMCPDFKDKWLREPKIFWNGIKKQEQKPKLDEFGNQVDAEIVWVEVPESDYPYYPIVKRITEDIRISETQGRGEIDAYVQETACGLTTALVNMSTASSKTMWSPKQPDPTRTGGVAPKQTEMVIKHNAVWDQPMEAFNPPAPDPTLLNAIDKIDGQNGENLAQPAWTVNNREDSRKTATEIQSATQQNTQITSTQVVVLATCKAAIDNANWRIIQSQALQQLIAFLADPTTGQNNVEVIAMSWYLQPAGTTDVVERREQEMKMQADWPIYSQTPLALPFLQEYTRLRYPRFAESWIQQMQAADPTKQALASMIALVQELATDESGKFRPDIAPMEQQLQMALQNAQSLLTQQPGGQNAQQQPNPGGDTSVQSMVQ